MRTEDLKNEISKLAVTEKISLVEDVWDEIAESNVELPLPEWQKKELDRRLALYEAGKAETREWNEVYEEIRKKHK
ncbi:MAG: putative addiction module component (TIGR02574 family) [Gammaproteobacteria bacterium]|jgi:putative addiction module component (TIGR02574 family)